MSYLNFVSHFLFFRIQTLNNKLLIIGYLPNGVKIKLGGGVNLNLNLSLPFFYASPSGYGNWGNLVSDFPYGFLR